MIIALTGVTGNMGKEALKEVLKLGFIDAVKVLVLPNDKRVKNIKKLKDARIEIIKGNLADFGVCKKLIENADYVVNMAAVIPPHSDQYPEKAIECNEVGVDMLVKAIEEMANQPKLIHISTVALYGNRNSLHLWAQVGDPLLISPFDIYSATKLRGEFRVLESKISKFAVLRQSAMLHKNILFDNISDGLMFHTCFNAPLEWVTAHDSGVLIANIIKRDVEAKDLDHIFWNKCFNIGGGHENCLTGYDTLNDGFKLIGGSAKDFFEPRFNATRNFHGVWFYDGNVLDDMFHYLSQTATGFWQELKKENKIFGVAKIVPKGLIKQFVIKRLFKSENSPAYWVKHNDEAKIIAYFGSKENYDKLKKEWKDFPLLVENRNEKGEAVELSKLKDKSNASLIDCYFDKAKEITIDDLQRVAKAHGGSLLSTKFNGLYDQLEWQNSDGEKFVARPYTVLFAGHWFNPVYKSAVWDFDRLAKTDKIYSQLWYDSHDKDENYVYSFDEKFNARVDKR